MLSHLALKLASSGSFSTMLEPYKQLGDLFKFKLVFSFTTVMQKTVLGGSVGDQSHPFGMLEGWWPVAAPYILT